MPDYELPGAGRVKTFIYEHAPKRVQDWMQDRAADVRIAALMRESARQSDARQQLAIPQPSLNVVKDSATTLDADLKAARQSERYELPGAGRVKTFIYEHVPKRVQDWMQDRAADVRIAALMRESTRQSDARQQLAIPQPSLNVVKDSATTLDADLKAARQSERYELPGAGRVKTFIYEHVPKRVQDWMQDRAADVRIAALMRESTRQSDARQQLAIPQPSLNVVKDSATTLDADLKAARQSERSPGRQISEPSQARGMRL